MSKFSSLSDIFLDSFQTPWTRESVESTKKWLEYESFEYESRLDPSLFLFLFRFDTGLRREALRDLL